MPEPEMSVDEWAAKHAEGVLIAAQAMEGQAVLLKSLSSDVTRLDRSQRLLKIILSVVVVLLVLAFGSLAYLVKTGLTARASQNILLDCNTPTSSKTTHPCSDRQRTELFDTATAIVYCDKNMPFPSHTIDIRQCIAASLGTKLDPVLPK